MDNDLVSILIPTYKRTDKLKKSIKSALNQTYENIEIIVIDDNDPETLDREKNEILMDQMKKEYKNIVYIKHEKNKNGAAARNTGIKKAKGKYIAFLDDDDEFFKQKIEIQYKYLKENPNFKAVSCGYEFCRQRLCKYI